MTGRFHPRKIRPRKIRPRKIRPRKIRRIFPVSPTIEFFIFFLNVFNVFFSVESENDIIFLEKQIGRKLFNFKVIYFLCNTEEIHTFILPLFQSKNHVI